MKLVTQDYGCGTSSSILDYDDGKHAIVVSEDEWKHVLDADDDLLLIGHDFLWFMWNTPDKIAMWKSFPHRVAVWCFERVDAIVPAWAQKSHHSISCIKQFADEIYACDEDDCDKYGYKWLPQWASRRFYDQRNQLVSEDRMLFSGQAGKPEYHARNVLLSSITSDPSISEKIKISNISRSLSWDSYIENFLSHRFIINPVGVLKAFNTRAYEAIYSGRILLQHVVGEYSRHQNMLESCPRIFYFNDYNGLKRIIESNSFENLENTCYDLFESNSLYARLASLCS